MTVKQGAVDVHIRTLRQKLGDCGNLIETIRGVRDIGLEMEDETTYTEPRRDYGGSFRDIDLYCGKRCYVPENTIII